MIVPLLLLWGGKKKKRLNLFHTTCLWFLHCYLWYRVSCCRCIRKLKPQANLEPLMHVKDLWFKGVHQKWNSGNEMGITFLVGDAYLGRLRRKALSPNVTRILRFQFSKYSVLLPCLFPVEKQDLTVKLLMAFEFCNMSIWCFHAFPVQSLKGLH